VIVYLNFVVLSNLPNNQVVNEVIDFPLTFASLVRTWFASLNLHVKVDCFIMVQITFKPVPIKVDTVERESFQLLKLLNIKNPITTNKLFAIGVLWVFSCKKNRFYAFECHILRE